MHVLLKTSFAACAVALAGQSFAQVTFYQNENYQGPTFTTEQEVRNLQRMGFNDRASSVVVKGNSWEVCDDANFKGRCVIMRPGNYPNMNGTGLNDRVSSVRVVDGNARIDEGRYVPVPAPAPASAQVVFFEGENFQGRSFTAQSQIDDFTRYGFNDMASSAVVLGERWEACDNIRFGGRCVVMRPGNYPSLKAMGMVNRVSSVRAIDGNTRIDDARYAPVPGAQPAGTQVVFYEGENFQGRSFTAQNQIDDFTRYGFNDMASSAVVLGDRWEACENVRFGGRCVVMRPGRYPSLQTMGMTNRVSSVRAVNYDANVNDSRYAPLPTAVYDNRRRNDERLYEVNVTSVRAVVGPAEQRCWMERQPVAQAPATGNANVGGAILGALIGGVLGHQVGGGVGKDLATAGGAVAGGVLGSKVGRNNSGQAAVGQDVQRCTTDTAQTAPAYWDVTYNFRGQEHRVQMTSAPGPTITVNGQGEPRA